MKEGSNPFKDVQNNLGFLLAGFGGIISFLGLQSAEVTTVLRNDPGQASMVAAGRGAHPGIRDGRVTGSQGPLPGRRVR